MGLANGILHRLAKTRRFSMPRTMPRRHLLPLVAVAGTLTACDAAPPDSRLSVIEADSLGTPTVTVRGEGDRYEIAVISEAFAGASRVKRQQMVYAAIADLIGDGSVHAVTIVTQTPDQAGQ